MLTNALPPQKTMLFVGCEVRHRNLKSLEALKAEVGSFIEIC